MTVGGVSGGSGFLQVNQMVSRLGEEKAAMYMNRSKSHYEVSNFGNETKLGTFTTSTSSSGGMRGGMSTSDSFQTLSLDSTVD